MDNYLGDGHAFIDFKMFHPTAERYSQRLDIHSTGLKNVRSDATVRANMQD